MNSRKGKATGPRAGLPAEPVRTTPVAAAQLAGPVSRVK